MDAVQQRQKYIYANRTREYQNLVWHHRSLDDLAVESPHLHKLALLSRKLDADTDCIEKKFANLPTTELLHNVHVYTNNMDEGKSCVELHVDFLTVAERQRLYPFWGGHWSRRANFEKTLVEELGQDESAFCQNDERQHQWHQTGKVRLSHSLKSRGANSHCAVIVGYRHGAGGNLITNDTWEKYERERGLYDTAFKNPFLVWARVGGEYGYWGGQEVATQLMEAQEFLRWEREQPYFKEAFQVWPKQCYKFYQHILTSFINKTCRL